MKPNPIVDVYNDAGEIVTSMEWSDVLEEYPSLWYSDIERLLSRDCQYRVSSDGGDYFMLHQGVFT